MTREIAAVRKRWAMQFSTNALYSRGNPFAGLAVGRAQALLPLEHVEAQQRRERPGHEHRRDQRPRHDDRQRVDEVAGLALHQQQRQERHDVGQRRVEDRVGEALGPSHAAMCRGWPCRQLAVDRVGRDDRRVHQQPQRDDQRRDRDLLEVDPDQLRQAQGHRDRHRDGDGDQQRAAPLHEHQRHQHHDDDRLDQVLVEAVDLLANLLRLVARALDAQVRREQLLQVRDRRVHVAVVVGDVRALDLPHGDA